MAITSHAAAPALKVDFQKALPPPTLVEKFS
jgi:hypothetical protein